MKLVDTHSHMYLPQFEDDLNACMEEAKSDGVVYTILPNIDVNSIPQLQGLKNAFPNQCGSMMGLHPCSVRADFREQLDTIYTELTSGNYLAVGEIGIDLYWDKSNLPEQIEAFEIQIDWAKEHSLPIAIHARESFDEIFEVLDRKHDDRLRGVFHCFTGNSDQAARALDYSGFYLGIGGVVTFKNSGLDKVVREIDLKHLVLETDAPYLSPHPFRGKRNETKRTRLVAEKVADVQGKSIEEVARITTENAKNLFDLHEI